jgi:hypothetical protein
MKSGVRDAPHLARLIRPFFLTYNLGTLRVTDVPPVVTISRSTNRSRPLTRTQG